LFSFSGNAQQVPSPVPDYWIKSDSSLREDQLNFNPGFRSDSLHVWDSLWLILEHGEVTVFVVYQIGDTAAEQGLWSIEASNGATIGLTTRKLLTEYGSMHYSNLNRPEVVVNSLSLSFSEEVPDSSLALLRIGYCDSLTFGGKIAEFIFFNQRISDTLWQQWISYLGVKYGATLEGVNYISSEKEITWNTTLNGTHAFSICGIGRDDNFGLYQKQSYGMNHRLIFGVGEPAERNDLNVNTFKNEHFMLLGSDSIGLATSRYLYLNNGLELQTYGNFKIQVTGDTMHRLPTFLQVDASEFEGELSAYSLLIDESGVGEYELSGLKDYLPTFIDTLNKILYYSHLLFDEDGSGSDVFCFARLTSIPPQTLGHVSNPDLHFISEAVNSSPYEYKYSEMSMKNRAIIESAYSDSQGNFYFLYPNPTSGNFTLQLQYTGVTDVKITFYNSEGKEVKKWYGEGQSHYIFSSSLNMQGHYLLDIISDYEHKGIKMIVQ
jgi:hypothetical protein